MNTEEIINYIKHYIDEDKTKSAIMLTGEWGSGKSYFIQNELITRLDKKCAIVSLYGLNNLFEVNRSLYFELRFKSENKKSEVYSASKLVAKTVAKGIASYFGIDLNISEKDLQKMYNSVNAKNKLIIFEDVERSNIGILDFLGYVNNLVEQDGCKVMLVTNEAEFIKYEEKKYNSNSQKQQNELYERFSDEEDKIFTNTTKEYLSKKEKTIGDTIHFACDFENSFKSIMSTFDNYKLNIFNDDEHIKEIKNICEYRSNFNLRALIFACQKTVDIYKEIKNLDNEFAKAIFYSIIAFSLKMNSGEDIKWIGSPLFSTYLGYGEFPLFHFCYHYIMQHTIIRNEIESAEKDYREFKLNNKDYNYNDEDLKILYSYYLHYEEDVNIAINNIEKKLKDNLVPYIEYGRIANYAISLSFNLNIDISIIKKFLVNNLKYKDRNLEMHIRFSSGIEIMNDIKRKEFIELQDQMVNSLYSEESNIFEFINSGIEEFCEAIENKNIQYVSNGAFASLINIDNFIENLKQCSPSLIYRLRIDFMSVYASVNIKEFLYNDKNMIDQLILKVENLSTYSNFDNVQKLQCKWFVNNLKEISKKLEY